MHSIFYIRILHQKGITKMNLSSEMEKIKLMIAKNANVFNIQMDQTTMMQLKKCH